MSSAKKLVKVVLDTNVYLSALLFGGIPNEIVELARDGKIELITSPSILLELGRILQEKFKFKRKQLLQVLYEICRISKECAEKANADYLVAGDKKRIRPLGRHKNALIKLPAEFINLI